MDMGLGFELKNEKNMQEQRLVDFHEDCEFSDAILRYINHILMEEDVEEQICSLNDLDLQAAERSFYEVLGETYPPPPVNSHSSCKNINFTSSEDHSSVNFINTPTISGSSKDYDNHSAPQSSYSNELPQAPYQNQQVNHLGFYEYSDLALQFQRGAEEARKFLPDSQRFFHDRSTAEKTRPENKEDGKESQSDLDTHFRPGEAERSNQEKADVIKELHTRLRGKKNSHRGEDEEEKTKKQAAVYDEAPLRSEMFDTVLLCNGGRGLSDLRESLQSKAAERREGKTGKGRREKTRHSEVVDLRTLLLLCAEAVAVNDRGVGLQLLRKIRQHSSRTGDGNQRVSHYFADGLEARLAGTGSQIYRSLVRNMPSAADILKAYHLYSAVCPFFKVSYFFSNRTILGASEKAEAVHIVDFGIQYGFQWPTLFQRLAERPGGPPMVRITGVDFPRPGFRPAHLIVETGRRLANYAESFGVPFRYKGIAKKWETVSMDELEIERGEMIIVNGLYHFRKVLDESVTEESARDTVLKLIREVNPCVFILGASNCSFSVPFFATRFREALFHFSALFDMLEMNVPRDDDERLLIESRVFGIEVINVVACEGCERVERPETYRQWQVRNRRAGFAEVAANREIVRSARERVKANYHGNFTVDTDGHWLLQGWKGRVIFALSCWKPGPPP